MTLSSWLTLVRWDLRVNKGMSWDRLRAMLLVLEIRSEQFVYRRTHARNHWMGSLIWFILRGFGSIFQWFLCNSNIPGSVTIGRGLRLPHPQNIIVAAYADIGEFCTIYHNVTIAWNGFKQTVPLSPKLGDGVLVGASAVIIGDITIGSDVLIGAGTVVTHSVPSSSRVTCPLAVVTPRHPSEQAAEPGSDRHLNDPYAIWR